MHVAEVAAGKVSKGPDHEELPVLSTEVQMFFPSGYKESMKDSKQRINTSEASF